MIQTARKGSAAGTENARLQSLVRLIRIVSMERFVSTDSATDQKMDACLIVIVWTERNVSEENARRIILVKRILIAQITIFVSRASVGQTHAGDTAIKTITETQFKYAWFV